MSKNEKWKVGEEGMTWKLRSGDGVGGEGITLYLLKLNPQANAYSTPSIITLSTGPPFLFILLLSTSFHVLMLSLVR